MSPIVYEDPVKWPGVPEITDSVCLQIVDYGPEIVILSTFKFPDSDGGRHLDAKWFYKTLTNGERVKRQWVIYSQSKDVLFCFPCLLFGKSRKSSPFSDIYKGFQDWKHLNPLVQTHENCSIHRLCYMEWKDLQKRLRKEKNTGR